MKRTYLLATVLVVAIVGGGIGAWLTGRYITNFDPPYLSIEQHQQVKLTGTPPDTGYRVPNELNFLSASDKVIAGVVHIRTAYGPGSFSLNPLEYYYRLPMRSSGSGVIITDDGYIVTNNHVVEDATNIEVVLNNNQRFYAKLVGTDPSTDLALLKVRAKNLPFVPYGNSDEIRPGVWVLAIGNPFDLTSTVTAGIVSAKARNIGILRDRNNLQVESFIQTDAAVNPGNSGGALVNLKGELIGINTAIATSTGQYSGYSFAIPVSLVKKVMDDLLEFGQVQRGLLGVQIENVDASIAEQLNLTTSQGVLVRRVNQGSAAEESGILEGDVITAIDRQRVNTVSELQEWVARKRPGKLVTVTFIRNGKSAEVETRLKDNSGRTDVLVENEQVAIEGLELKEAALNDLARMNLEGGVVVSRSEGKWQEAGIKPGLIIGFLDKVPVDDVKDFYRMLQYKKGGILIEGYTLTGEKKIVRNRVVKM
ncbi:trypsin-like peptidase domain-containing protein [Oscillatoria amoena NRMC-F 0135]|nr:trypsin-like peptidase domain-containing protein [Oscillatoria amoena NRMC-F 0135]